MLHMEHVFVRLGAGAWTVRDLSLKLSAGRRVVVVGRSGSGKSTLARLASGSLTPQSGVVALEKGERACLVRQDPTTSFVSSHVWDDVAFGPMNLGLAEDEVRRRVAASLDAVGAKDLARRTVGELSGGQQQLVALAGALAMSPSFLVADEVTAQLDLRARRQLRGVLDALCARGMGIFEVTHRPEEVLGAHRVLVLKEGALAWEGTPDELFSARGARAREIAGLVGLRARLLAGEEPPSAYFLKPLVDDTPRASPGPVGECASGQGLELRHVSLWYDDARRPPAAPALRDVELTARRGRVTLLVGPSGAGKTTCALVAAGLAKPDEGSVRLAGRHVRPSDVGLAFQRPADQLFADSVRQDVMYGPLNRGMGQDEAHRRAVLALRDLGVAEELWDRSPLLLSGGEARRAALAGIVALRPGAYVLDEPTAGLDGHAAQAVMDLANLLARRGAAVVVITHEVAEWLNRAATVCVLSAGTVVWSGSPEALVRDPALAAAAGLDLPRDLRKAEVDDGAF
ncbi:ABC transporter ATP-binding protein [Olsenella massiliensis]|uniref:ABC transporter ATP-binding protein n=1 Tax=Olsenella massiliensis TaxID=1622075 RepID=UPI00071C2B94|nr:ATP-binding cassette domain-containing protein [Olsenella massiliensis]